MSPLAHLVRVLSITAVLATGPAAAEDAFDHDHRAFSAFLSQHVSWFADGHRSAVAYRSAGEDRGALRNYLASLATVRREDFDGWNRAQQLAFLLNAYNAATIDRILREESLPDSIRDLGSLFSAIWKEEFVTLLGATRSLDDIEHGILRVEFDEPLIHAGLVCASCSCPPLRPEAFTGDGLAGQLADSMRRFLGDRGRNRVDPKRRRLELSKIFDWFAEDFEDDAGEIGPFLAGWSDALADDEAGATLIASGDYRLRYLPYDWSLNAPGNCPD